MVSELYRCIGSLYAFIRCVFFSCLLIFSCCTKGGQEKSIDAGVLLEEMRGLEQTGKWVFKEMNQELVPEHRKNDRFLLIIDSTFLARNLLPVNGKLYLERGYKRKLDQVEYWDLYLGGSSWLGANTDAIAENYLASYLMNMLERNKNKRTFAKRDISFDIDADPVVIPKKIVECDCSLLGVDTGEFFVDDALEKGLFDYSAVVRYTCNLYNNIECRIQNITCVNSNNKPGMEIQEVDTSPCLPQETFVLPPSKVGVDGAESLAEYVMLSANEQIEHIKAIDKVIEEDQYENISELLERNVIFDVNNEHVNKNINCLIHNVTKPISNSQNGQPEFNVDPCCLSVVTYLCKSVIILEEISELNDLLLYAIHNNSIDLVKIMLNKMDETHFSEHKEWQNECLSIAVKLGYIGMVEFLLSQGADVSGRNYAPSPLCIAVKNKRIDMVNVLLERGADPNINYGNLFEHDPLLQAIAKGCYNIFKSLIDHGYNINKEYKVNTLRVTSPLLMSLRNDLFDLTAYLLAKDVNISADAHYTNNPLCISMGGSEKLFDLILAKVADVNVIVDPILFSALSWSLEKNKNHIYIKKLLDKGADTNLSYRWVRGILKAKEYTMGPANLCLALDTNKSNCYDLISLLLSFGANPNIHEQGKAGIHNSPLHKAVNDKCANTARLLVTNGAKVELDIEDKYRDLLKKNDLEDTRNSPFMLKTLTFKSINRTLGSFTCPVERKKAIEKLGIPNDFKTILYKGYDFDNNKDDNATFHVNHRNRSRDSRTKCIWTRPFNLDKCICS
ncbi:MAG: ankyrin repeat domain-containing protein [Candidatus Endonucleobacter sp. (ex Gigantidas childressi)]|nr:ankyrin repeat domain-containing protein [Candidatus Endonucleobacter sp. (ex Gigantidas childressi)]